MPTKLCIPTIIRRGDHPWDPNVVEYDVLHMVDGEPVWDHSGQRLTGLTITGATTLDDIQAIIVADATARGWLA